MARAKRANLAPVMIFAGVAAAAAAGGWAIIRFGSLGGTAAKPPAAPALPTAALQFAGASLTEAHYLGGVWRSGGAVQADVLIVGQTADTLAHQYGFIAKHETIDCRARTIADELAGEYDGKGKLKNTEFFTGSIGRPAAFTDFEVAAVCQGKAAPAWRTVADWRAAQRASQVPPDDLLAAAQGNPGDAESWAWLCHGAPWRWRPQSFDDCDHAVSLQPQAAATRLDRGYVNLATGHYGVAGGDFRAILARDGDHAAALYGKSLVEALGGDKAGAKRDRDRALDLDPTIPDWAEHTFRFQISDPYRGR